MHDGAVLALITHCFQVRDHTLIPNCQRHSAWMRDNIYTATVSGEAAEIRDGAEAFRQDLDLRLQVVPPPTQIQQPLLFLRNGAFPVTSAGPEDASVAFLHRRFPSADSAATVHTRRKKEHVIILWRVPV